MITVPVTFDSANRKRDRSLSFRLTSNLEVSNEDFAQIDKLVLTSGWLAYSENEINEAEMPPEPAGVKEGKPKIQRMRAVFYLLWLKTDQSIPFELYWDSKFEAVLQHYKNLLDD